MVYASVDSVLAVFENVGVSGIPVDNASSAYLMQTTWMKGALNDPCLFHATLFAGSSCFDLLRTAKQSPITLFHQNEAIRIINQRLSNPTWALEDSTILAITPLALFSALNADQTAANVHRMGLERLAQLRGGLDKLGLDGLTSTLINRNTMIYHIAFDTDRRNDISVPPIGLESRILDPTTKGNTIPPYLSISLVKQLFQEIHNFKLDWISKISATGLRHPFVDRSGPDFRFNANLPATQDPIYHCCFLATQIFWAMVDGRKQVLDALVANLKAFLSFTDEKLWLCYLPVEYSWVCFTGAAASRDAELRLWFYFRQSSSVRLVRVSEEPGYLGDLWSHLQWLRMIGL
ncbi:hypothetical protein PMG11_10742 [Penicillium brasilianum]|uniref:Uncharacterized protein n=1 Tax=Penicillium brasilianum TaxID=104259 RepID=A0A0F7U4B1_PENBI|nr:hypothetical protein PMG11_10742 [Penicillium brasilianum]